MFFVKLRTLNITYKRNLVLINGIRFLFTYWLIIYAVTSLKMQADPLCAFGLDRHYDCIFFI